MADTTKRMNMVSDVVHGPDGNSVLYGPGEMHDPGSLPEGVAYREVLVTEEQIAAAPAHAQDAPAEPKTEAEAAPAPDPEPAPAKAGKSGKM